MLVYSTNIWRNLNIFNLIEHFVYDKQTLKKQCHKSLEKIREMWAEQLKSQTKWIKKKVHE